MSFHVGQQVVCVAAFGDYSPFNITVPTKDRVYQIRGITIDGDGPGLLLEEIINTPAYYVNAPHSEPSFQAENFRPLIERKTDIGVFTALLDPMKHKYLEKA